MKNYKNKDLVRIHYASLNFKDVMLATGKLQPEVIIKNRKDLDYVLGIEYSGIGIDGRRYMGMNANR